MRYCPTCSHIYSDDDVKFCPNDGGPVVDHPSPGQVSVQPAQSMASTPMAESIDPDGFDPEVTLSRGFSVQETMLPSESRNVIQEEAVASSGASEPPRSGENKFEVSMSEAVTPAEKSQPKLELQSQPVSQPQLQSQSQSNIQPPSQAQSQPPLKAQPKVQPPKLQSKSQSARKRRLLLVLVVIVATPLIGVAGGFFWWQHFKTTPAYQLALLFDAVHRNDQATVDKIVAMDSITDSFASQVTQNVLSQNTSAAESERKKLESSVSGLAPSIKETVRAEVEKQVKDEAAPSAGKSFLMMALALPYKVGIKEAGDTATVAAQTHPVSWTMQRSSAAWTIVAVKDEALASRIQEQVTSELPATGGAKTQNSASRQNNLPAAGQQKNAAGQQKNSTDSSQAKNSQAKKKERKQPEKGITIDLRKLPWPD